MTSCENTAVFVVADGLIVAVLFSILYPHTTDVDGAVTVILKESDIPYGVVVSIGNNDVGLYAEEAGLGFGTVFVF